MSPTALPPGASATAVQQALEDRLQTLAPQALTLIDDSHLHAGHAGAENGARHFRLKIVSKQFEGLNTLARHRLVYDCVQDLMPYPIHALAIEATSLSQEG